MLMRFAVNSVGEITEVNSRAGAGVVNSGKSRAGVADSRAGVVNWVWFVITLVRPCVGYYRYESQCPVNKSLGALLVRFIIALVGWCVCVLLIVRRVISSASALSIGVVYS